MQCCPIGHKESSEFRFMLRRREREWGRYTHMTTTPWWWQRPESNRIRLTEKGRVQQALPSPLSNRQTKPSKSLLPMPATVSTLPTLPLPTPPKQDRRQPTPVSLPSPHGKEVTLAHITYTGHALPKHEKWCRSASQYGRNSERYCYLPIPLANQACQQLMPTAQAFKGILQNYYFVKLTKL